MSRSYQHQCFHGDIFSEMQYGIDEDFLPAGLDMMTQQCSLIYETTNISIYSIPLMKMKYFIVEEKQHIAKHHCLKCVSWTPCIPVAPVQGLYSLSGRTSYRKILWSLEAARFKFRLFQSLCNLTGTSAAVLLRSSSNFRSIQSLKHPISWLWDFTISCGKVSIRLVNRGPLPCPRPGT